MNRSARYSIVGFAAVFITAATFLSIAQIVPDRPPEIFDQEESLSLELISMEQLHELFPFGRVAPLSLTKADHCRINLLRSRGNKADLCRANCMAKMQGLGIGGGCAHRCRSRGARVRDRDYEFPAGYWECERRSGGIWQLLISAKASFAF